MELEPPTNANFGGMAMEVDEDVNLDNLYFGGDGHADTRNIRSVCCIGAGRTGVFCMLVLARHHPNIQFYIVDSNEALINRWKNNELPFHEPDLQNRLAVQMGVNLHFSLNIEYEIREARVVFITVDVPTKQKDEGKKARLDLTEWEKAVRIIGAVTITNRPKMIVEKSTMPLEFSNKIVDILAEYRAIHNFEVMSNPEFFSQGTAFRDLENPDQVVIASKTNSGVDMLIALYRWVRGDRIKILNDPKSVELSKLVCNAYLAMKVTHMHSLTMLSDRIGTDINDVCSIVGSDSRINNLFIDPGVSFGGSGLNKDVAYLAYLADFYKLPEIAKHFRSVLKLNQTNNRLFVTKILEMMLSLRGKNVAVYGFSYKKNTDDIRHSRSIDICQRLLEEGAEVRVFDPVVPTETIRSCFSRNARLTVVATMEAAWENADALCFLVDWQQFRETIIDNSIQVYDAMRTPAFFIDGCNGGYPYDDLRVNGFKLYVPGRPQFSQPL